MSNQSKKLGSRIVGKYYIQAMYIVLDDGYETFVVECANTDNDDIERLITHDIHKAVFRYNEYLQRGLNL